MAISIITNPNTYEPVYTNSMPIVVGSTFVNQDNYKYIFKLYDVDINQLITTIATYPRPTGSGLYSPHYALQANCETSLDPSLIFISQDQEARIRWRYNIGEQYNPGLTFSDTVFVSGFVGLTFSTNISTQFSIGDIITISKDDISINVEYNGTASITSIPGASYIVTNIPWGTNTSNETGTIVNLIRSVATSSVFVGWNGTRQYGDFQNFFASYVLNRTGTLNKLLSAYETSYTSDLTQKKSIYIDDFETLDIMVATSSFTATQSNVYSTYKYYDSNNTLLGTDVVKSLFTDVNIIRYQIPSGTGNIFNIGGAGAGFITAGSLDNYSITIGLGDGTQSTAGRTISDTFTYQVIPSCRPYEIIRLAFLNKLGGYDYFNFNLVSRYTSDIQRTQINRALQPQYSIGDRGRDIIYSSAVENWTINSDGLTDSDALFVRELVESSSVFLINGRAILPIVITSNSWVYKSGLLDGFVQYTITFQKANDVYINR